MGDNKLVRARFSRWEIVTLRNCNKKATCKVINCVCMCVCVGGVRTKGTILLALL